MKLSEIKMHLANLELVEFILPDGAKVPENFHVTEVGEITKKFIDCGGTIRHETTVNFQLWNANDYEHRLKPAKLLSIIALSEQILAIGDHEIEVEFQDKTIGKYDLGFNGTEFLLRNKQTACLAEDACGIPQKQNVALSDLQAQSSCCTPGGNCC